MPLAYKPYHKWFKIFEIKAHTFAVWAFLLLCGQLEGWSLKTPPRQKNAMEGKLIKP